MNNNQEIYINRFNQFHSQYYIENYDKNVLIDVILDLDYYTQSIAYEIEDFIYDLDSNGFKTQVFICYAWRYFNEESINAIKDISEELKEDNILLYMKGDFKDDYTLEEYIATRNKLEKVISNIRNKNLSPLETYIAIFRYATNKPYKINDNEEEDRYMCRDLISVINSDYRVCYGYVAIVKYLCDAFNIPCIQQAVKIDRDHINCLVYIKDDKYQIDGLYFSDPTWCYASDEIPHHYEFLLLALDDYKYFKLKHYSFNGDTAVIYHDEKFDNEAFFNIYTFEGLGFLNNDERKITPLTNYLGLGYKVDEIKEYYKKELENNSTRTNKKIEEAISLFTNLGITDDYFKDAMIIPFGTNVSDIFALVYLDENEEAIEKIKSLKSFIDNNTDIGVGEGMYAHYNSSIKNAFNTVVKEDYDIALLAWTLTKMIMKERLLEALSEKAMKAGKPIDIDTFKNAIKIVDDTYNVSDELYNLEIDYSIKCAEDAYKKGTSNAFYYATVSDESSFEE